MPLSSNSLIHFTQTKEALFGILESAFKVSYCKESLWFGDYKAEFHVPMVSFCDIPLSQIKDHMFKYGEYGIGLRKEWAIKNMLNPVLYFQRRSHVSQSLEFAIRFFTRNGGPGEDNANYLEDYRGALDALMDTVRYAKHYEADLERGGTKYEKYRFSDEREWRFVPPHHLKSCPNWIDEPATAEQLAAAKEVLRDARLQFTPNDIKYIIIKNDSEISECVHHLRLAKQKYSYEDVDRLTTRILTAEQIREDV